MRMERSEGPEGLREAMFAEHVTEWTEKWKQEGFREGRMGGFAE